MSGRCLIYFVKYPEPGKVKTRLARRVGAERAAEAYRDLASENFLKLSRVQEEKIDFVVCFDPPEREQDIRKWLSGASSYRPQSYGDLGRRLRHAFDVQFEAGYSQIMVYGSDTLDADAGDIIQAFDDLEKSDLVIGPAADGGYYALAMKNRHTELFEGIPWSTAKVKAKTLEKAAKCGLTVAQMKQLEDMDETIRGEAL